MAWPVARATFVRRRSEAFDTMVNRDPIGQRIHELLEQAAGFARARDLPGAVARAYWARRELDANEAVLTGDDWIAEGLHARVKYATEEYERRLQKWQRENVARQTAYVERERAAIGAAPDNPADSPANVRKKTFRSRALTSVRRAFAAELR